MEGKIIILAAGKGTRIGAVDKPKVLLELAGRPMIEHLLSHIVGRPIAVVGFGADLVKQQLGERVDYALQTEQLGTGHAVASAKELLKNFKGPIVVLYGDHPLVSSTTIATLFSLYEKFQAHVSMLTTDVTDFSDWREGFYAYGRILRDDDLQISAIRELKDCSESEKEIKELNPGYYCFDSEWLWKNIDQLQNNNQQKEYYLTDLVEMAVAQGENIPSEKLDPIECLGINTKEQLAIVERLFK